MLQNEFPLSFSQTRLFLISELSPDSDAYNANLVFKLNGKLDLHILEKSLLTLIERHAILRTTFYRNKSGECYQCVHSDINFSLSKNPQLNVNNSETIQDIIRSKIKKVFDLKNGPLIRV